MKTIYTLTLLILISLLTNFQTIAQLSSNTIVLKNNEIEIPEIFDFGNIDNGTQMMEKFVIVNERETSVEITNLSTPTGYKVSVSKKELKPQSQTTVIVALDSNWIEHKGEFTEKIIIETNLVQDIVIEFKGTYLE